MHSKAEEQCSQKSHLHLVHYSAEVSHEQESFTEPLCLVPDKERNPDLPTIWSAICERYSEWLQHFLPFALLRWESRQDYKNTTGCSRFTSSAVSLKSQHSIFPCKLNAANRSCSSRGKRRQEALEKCISQWRPDMTQNAKAADLPHSSRAAAIAQQTSLSERHHSCVLFMLYFRRKKTAL